MLAGMDHPNIVRVTDVFEENGTAYYVMDILPGGSLRDKVKADGPLSEADAKKYIRQVADALAYIHARDTVHLDVKPSNILLDAKGDAVLVDFGISKHYDSAGEQTSSTPVCLSRGYAPLEQGRDGDVSQFSPSTDIYALGATLYYLLSGQDPPEAALVLEDGLPRPRGISDRMWNTVESAMRPIRKDRPQSIAEFLALLSAPSKQYVVDDASDRTTVKQWPAPAPKPAPWPVPEPTNSKSKDRLWIILGGIVALVVILVLIIRGNGRVPAGYVDLGLPSGTLWKAKNEGGFFTFDQAVSRFGNQLPTENQLRELKDCCKWYRTISGYRITGPNGKTIDLPATGKKDTPLYESGTSGYYWSSTPVDSRSAFALDYSGSNSIVLVYALGRSEGLSVRLVYH